MSFLAKAPNAQYLALDSLIQTKKYEELAEQLK
jgi:mannitol-specific phosphotransferase system IIBC component